MRQPAQHVLGVLADPVAGLDTLAQLGKRYGMSVGSMERVNRRSRRDPLKAGEKIVVYAEQARAGTPTTGEAGPVALGDAEAPHPEALPNYHGQSAHAPSRARVPARIKTLD